MASKATDSNTESLTREDLIKKVKQLESLLIGKDRMIQGQNNTIQTLTVQNFMFRDLLKKVLDLKPGFFGFAKGEFIELQERIREKLKERTTKAQNSTLDSLTEQNVILRDLVEQFLNLKIGVFSLGKLTNFQSIARETLNKLRGR